MNDTDWDACLFGASARGDILAFKEALANGADYLSRTDVVFAQAINHDHAAMVRYLLTSPELPTHPSVHYGHDSAFRHACATGDLEQAVFLASSPELTEHADVHACCDEAFEQACLGGHEPVIRYLVERHDILKSEHVAYFLANNADMREMLAGMGIAPAGQG